MWIAVYAAATWLVLSVPVALVAGRLLGRAEQPYPAPPRPSVAAGVLGLNPRPDAAGPA